MPLRKLCIVHSSHVECRVIGFKDTATKFPYNVGDCVMLTNTRSDGTQMIQGTDTNITACQREPTPEYYVAAPEEEEMLVKPFRYVCDKDSEEPEF